MYKIKKFENNNFKFVDESIKEIFPKLIKIYTSNGNFTLTLSDFTRESNVIKANYYHNTFKNSHSSRDGEPDFLMFDMHFVNNENGLKTIIDITYGDFMVYAFSIEAPNKIVITHYNGIDSLFDKETQFGFEDESISELKQLFNKFSEDYQLTEKDFTFLDKYPDTFDATQLSFVPDSKMNYHQQEKELVLPTNSEKPGEAALSHGKKVLVINNSLPPKHRYLQNILKYLQVRGINNVVVSNMKELEDVIKKYKISCVISSGSDKRVKDDEATAMTFRALEELNCPFLGICFGFQSLSKYYGSKIDNDKFTHKNIEVELINPEHFLFSDLLSDEFDFSFSFNDFPVDCPNGFEVLCKVDGKIAGIANNKLKRFGFLFHPEDIQHSHKILDNFILLTDKQKIEQDKLKLGKFESVITFNQFKIRNGK